MKKLIELTEKEESAYQRLLSIASRCNEVEVFELLGVMYMGNIIAVCKSFVHNNPQPADFDVWVDKNYKRLIESAKVN